MFATQPRPFRSTSSFAGLLSRASSFNNINFLHKSSDSNDRNGTSSVKSLQVRGTFFYIRPLSHRATSHLQLQGARSSSNLTAFSMLKMKRVGHKGSRKSKSKSKRGNRERTAARKERKATQTLAIVLGERERSMIQETT